MDKPSDGVGYFLDDEVNPGCVFHEMAYCRSEEGGVAVGRVKVVRFCS